MFDIEFTGVVTVTGSAFLLCNTPHGKYVKLTSFLAKDLTESLAEFVSAWVEEDAA